MTKEVQFIAHFSNGIPPRVATGMIQEGELKYLNSISESERKTYVCAIVGYPLEYADKITKIEIKDTDNKE